jgi:hypothetical protein
VAEASPYLGFAVRLALGTGLRRSDLVKLRWNDLKGDHFEVRQQKTGEPVLVGCTEELLAELGTMPRIADTIIVGDRGNPVTAASLSRMVRLKLREMGVTGYSIHGLRKNAGNEIAEQEVLSAKSWSGLVIKLRRWPPITQNAPAKKCRCGPLSKSWNGRERRKWQTHERTMHERVATPLT